MTTPDGIARSIIDTTPLMVRLMLAEARTQDPGQRLTPPQFRILALLQERPGIGLTELAELLGVRKPTASVMVLRLVTQGLVKVEAAVGRRRPLAPTAEGAALISRTRAGIEARLAARIASLDAAAQARLEDGLAELRALLTSAG